MNTASRLFRLTQSPAPRSKTMERELVPRSRSGTTSRPVGVSWSSKAHDIVQTMLSSQGPIVLIWRTYPSPEQASSEADILRRHVAAKKHQLGVPRAAGFLFDARIATLDQLVYDNRVPGPDPQLDEIAKYLKPPDAGRGVNALTVL